jgi:hypothetical protein
MALTSQMNIKEKLSLLWIFATFNYAYADLVSLFDPRLMSEVAGGSTGALAMTPELLFVGAIIMEIAIIMIVLSRILNYRANRYANIIAGSIKTVIIAASMFVGTPVMYYTFFAIIEIICTSLIVWYAWKWPRTEG